MQYGDGNQAGELITVRVSDDRFHVLWLGSDFPLRYIFEFVPTYVCRHASPNLSNIVTLAHRTFAALDADYALYQERYDKARAFFDDDEFEKAAKVAEKMIKEGNLPRYHRIKCYCLVAACLEDWIEASDLMERAESQWGMARYHVSMTGAPLPIAFFQ